MIIIINLFEIAGSIVLDDKGFNKGISDAIGKAESFGTKFANVAVGIGKVAAVGLGAAATAFGTFGTMSVKSYADYEQLVGGVETLFGTSSDTIMKYAEGAYKTANLSANQYMETITSFSASLLQGLGGDTQKAADIGNLAVTDMADNANKMGTGIEAIQNAYQGFAKDNFTMLDNLKLGYGGTGGEMARLINDSGVLGEAFEATADNVKDIPFHQMIEAIHTIQTEMGITGTTAIESSETISGSWNTLKSSWANVLTSIASGNEVFLSGSIDALVASTGDFAENVTETVTNLINNVTKVLPGIFAAFDPMMPLLFDTLLPAVADGAVTLITGLVDGMASNFPMVLSAGKQIIRILAEGIFGGSPQISDALDSVFGAFDNIITAITESGLIQNIISLLSKIGEKAVEITPYIAEIFSDTLVGIINGVSNAVAFLVEKFDLIKQTMIDSGLIDNIALLFEKISEKVSAVKTAIDPLGESLDDIFDETIVSIIQGVSDAIGFLAENFETVMAIIVPLTAAFGAWKFAISIAGIINAFTKAMDGMTFATKAAEFAQKLLNATMLSNPFVLITTLVVGLVAGIIYLWNTNENFRNAIIGAWEAIKTGVKAAVDAVTGFFKGLVDFFKENWKEVLLFITNPIAGAIAFLYKINPKFKEWVDGIFQFFKELPGKIAEKFNEIIQGIKDWIDNAVKTVQEFLPNLIESIVAFFKELPGKIKEIGSNLITGLWEGIQEKATWLVDNIKDFFGGIVDGVKDLFGIASPSKVFAGIGKNTVEGFAEGVEDNGNLATDSIDDLTGSIISAADSTPDELTEIGRAIADGLWEGIESKAAEIYRKVKDFFEGIVNGVKNFLGIHSPSTVFADMGINTGQGFINGILGMSSDINRAVDSVFGGLGGNVDYGVNFASGGATGGYNRGISQAAPTASMNTRAAAGAAAPTVVQHITLSVNVDKVDDIVKLTNVFQSFAHNQIVFEGV